MWVLKSGEAVVNRFNSHLHDCARAHVASALAQIDPKGSNFLVEEVVFDHIIGQTSCVVTRPDDTIFFAQRVGRQGRTRFVLDREPTPSRSLVVVLKRRDEVGYVLITAFVGSKAEPEPWDRNATEGSVAFWRSHALLWGSEPTVPGTETDICPW